MIWKSLIHYRRIHAAVILGAAVTTAVLAGSLLVGDSVRGSLAALVLERLGKIDHAIVARTFFREKLAADLERNPDFSKVVSVVLLQGTISHAESGRRASGIQIQGIGEDFLSFYDSSSPGIAELQDLVQQPGQPFPGIVINNSLAVQLDAKTGDQLLLRFEQYSEIPRESMLGEQDEQEMIRSLRLSVAAVVPDEGVGRFGLNPGQVLPINAFVRRDVLQRAMDQRGRANAILVAGGSDARLSEILQQTWDLEDTGLKLRSPSPAIVSVETREVFLSDPIARTVESAAAGSRLPLLIYIANRIEARDRMAPYSTVAALPQPVGKEFGALKLKDGSDAPPLQSGEILLNRWAGDDLGVEPGDSITLSYYVPGSENQLRSEQHTFRLAGIVEMTGLGADPTLAPEFPGMEEENMGDWDAPFPVDLSLIRSKDEEYWDQYRAAPKAFVSLEDGQRIWGSRYGSLTAIRFAASGPVEALRDSLLRNLRAEDAGYSFLQVRKRGMDAARGATDFSGLFIGFSFFLMIAACLLTALLFRLGVEFRASEIGLLLAVGYTERSVIRRLLLEGSVLAVAGVLLGLAGAAGYTAALLAALNRWWNPAIGASFLALHVTPASLALGGMLSFAVILASLWRSVRRLANSPAAGLLSGAVAIPQTVRPRAWVRAAAWALPVIALLLSVTAATAAESPAPALFFASGSFLMAGGLCIFSLWLRRVHSPVRSGVGGMAVRNSVWNPVRSLLSAALVCSACFVIVAVGANRRNLKSESIQKDSGTGGFSLLAQTDVPLLRPLSVQNTPAYSLRYLPGEDASCLNLYRPETPRVLGASDPLISRGGFLFSKMMETEQNPWILLDRDMPEGVIPAIGDANSVQWILHSGLGQDIAMQDGYGRPLKLRLVALLSDSIFQSELLISERNFLKHFPGRHGYSFFLIDAPPDQRDEVAKTLESEFADFGFDAVSTTDRIARFHAVENTYITVFQTLGGLGLMLGTLGLAVVLVRNIAERRKELATLQAFGFRRSRVGVMIWLENAFLLAVGISLGALSGIISVLPQLVNAPSQIPWLSLFVTLSLIFATGAVAGTVAAYVALRAPLLPALKGE